MKVLRIFFHLRTNCRILLLPDTHLSIYTNVHNAHMNNHIIYTGGPRAPCATTTREHAWDQVHRAQSHVYVHKTRAQCILPHVGTLRVGRTVHMLSIDFKRKRVGPQYKGTVLFMKMLQYNVMPERVENFYACAAMSETSEKYVRVQDLCTLLAEAPHRSGRDNMIDLVPIAQAFPVSWVVS
jgi:hypothetical protein